MEWLGRTRETARAERLATIRGWLLVRPTSSPEYEQVPERLREGRIRPETTRLPTLSSLQLRLLLDQVPQILRCNGRRAARQQCHRIVVEPVPEGSHAVE